MRARTRVGAMIFVQMGAEKFTEMYVGVHAYTPLRCGCAVHTDMHIRTLSIFVKTYFSLIKKTENAGAKNGVRMRAPHFTNFLQCVCGCGPKLPHTKGF